MANKKPVVIVSGRLANLPAGDTLDLTGADTYVLLDEHASAPATPGSGTVAFYAKADGFLYSKDDAGTETQLGGGSGSPGGANTQIQYNNSGAFGGDASFTINTSTSALTFTGDTVASPGNVSFTAASNSTLDGNGGQCIILGGQGNDDGSGGDVEFKGGQGGVNGNGGIAFIRGGAGGTTSGNGGNVEIYGGSSTSEDGGAIILTAANGAGSAGAGGDITVTAGDATGTASAGSIELTAGSSDAPSGGGEVKILGGLSGGDGGNVEITGGSSVTPTATAGGSVILTGGTATGTGGVGGDVGIYGGTSGAGATDGGHVWILGGETQAGGNTAGTVHVFGGEPNSTGSSATPGDVEIVGGGGWAGGGTDPGGDGGHVFISGGLGGVGTPTYGQPGDVVIGSDNTAASRVGNMLFIPTTTGTPTGTPNTYSGLVAMVYDTSNDVLYFYNSGWQSITGAGTSEPANQIVYGTGSGIDSSTDYTYVDDTKTITQTYNSNCKTKQYILQAETTDDTQTEMLMADSSQMVLSNDSSWRFEIHIVARRTDADNETAGYEIKGCIDRNTNAASTAIVGTVSVNVTAEDTAAWDVSVDADTTNGALRIRVTGQNSKTIRWVAFVRTVEVTG